MLSHKSRLWSPNFLSRPGLTLHAASQDFNLLIPSGPEEGMNCQGQSWHHWFGQKKEGEAGEASYIDSLPYEEANGDAASHGVNAWIRLRYNHGNCLLSPWTKSEDERTRHGAYVYAHLLAKLPPNSMSV